MTKTSDDEKTAELIRAICISSVAHAGQKYDDQDYFETHICQVVDNIIAMGGEEGSTQDENIVAYLHDVVEDTTMTGQDLLDQDISPENVERVLRLSKVEGASRVDYLKAVKGDPVSTRVKIADALANLTKSIYDGDERRVRKYLETLNYIYEV